MIQMYFLKPLLQVKFHITNQKIQIQENGDISSSFNKDKPNYKLNKKLLINSTNKKSIMSFWENKFKRKIK